MGWDWDVGQWFTPPKSKSPWEAMTKGSTGGWAKGFEPWGPAFTTAAGAIPGFGPFISTGMGLAGMAGKGTGFQGTDYGWKNLAPMAMGGLGGYGLGSMGSGVAGALKGIGTSGLGGTLSGFKGGMNQYFGTNIIPGMKGFNPTAWFGGSNAIPTSYGNMMQPTYGGLPALTGTASGNALGGLGIGSNLALTAGQGGVSGIAPGLTGAMTQVVGAQPTTSYWDQLVKGVTGGVGMTALGAGISAAGALGGKKISVPESPYMGEYTSRLLSGSPLSQFGTKGLQTMGEDWAKPEYAPLSDDMYDAAVRKNVEEEKRSEEQLRSEWKGIRPGADIESDSAFRKSLMENRQRFGNERMALRNELAYNREREYLGRLDNYFQNKTNYFINTLGLSQNEVNQYAQLAQLDTERLMAQTGLEAGQAAQFKQLFGDIGQLLMQKGLGLDYASMVKLMGQYNPTSNLSMGRVGG